MIGLGRGEIARPTGDTTLLGPPPLALLREPLEFFLAEHLRQRCLCAALRRIAADRRADRSLMVAISDVLRIDLPLHHMDEEQDLFPALLRRGRPEDDLGAIIRELGEDHRRFQVVADMIASRLSVLAQDEAPGLDPIFCGTLKLYADEESRHLAIENAIVMVIARKRLKTEDLIHISRNMKARRGAAA